jgi:hypothetical protein
MERVIDVTQRGESRNRYDLRCRICGANLYPTDQGTNAIIFHCSSSKARFWDFMRGTSDLKQAKKHWDLSRMELLLVSKQ